MSTYKNTDKFIERYAQRFNLEIDKDWSHRSARLHILQKFLNGSIYDNLEPFHHEYTGGTDTGTYVPLIKRRPCIIYKLAKIIVDTSVSMLFGEGHFPVPRCEEHEDTTQFLQFITRKFDLRSVMIDAARKGSVGSVVVLIKILSGKFYFESIHSIHCTPIFNRENPSELIKLIEKKKVDGDSLRSQGYTVKKDDLKIDFYLQREWTQTQEIYYQPYKVEDEEKENFSPVEDKDRTATHDFGFVPAVWIKNLPKSTGIDGHSTFEDLLDINIEIDYLLSQHNRLLRYNSDPTLVIKNPASLEGTQITKGIGALNLDEKGEAYFVEITTGATKSVMEFLKALRELALEMVRGNRSNPDKVHGAQSGEALKMLYFELISLVEEMRLTYGEYGLVTLYSMCLKIVKSDKYELDLGEYMPNTNEECENHLTLDWPAWYTPSALDKFNEAQTLATLIENQIISHETATTNIADEYNILDIDAEMKAIDDKASEMYDKEASLIGLGKNQPMDSASSKVEPEKKKKGKTECTDDTKDDEKQQSEQTTEAKKVAQEKKDDEDIKWRAKYKVSKEELETLKIKSDAEKQELATKAEQTEKARQVYEQKYVNAEVKAQAVTAGIKDIEFVKLIDTSEIKLDDKGNVVGVDKAISDLKTRKPDWFGTEKKVSSSNNAPFEGKEEPKKLDARTMSKEDWNKNKANYMAGQF